MAFCYKKHELLLSLMDKREYSCSSKCWPDFRVKIVSFNITHYIGDTVMTRKFSRFEFTWSSN
jgi:hypothetical protein